MNVTIGPDFIAQITGLPGPRHFNDVSTNLRRYLKDGKTQKEIYPRFLLHLFFWTLFLEGNNSEQWTGMFLAEPFSTISDTNCGNAQALPKIGCFIKNIIVWRDRIPFNVVPSLYKMQTAIYRTRIVCRWNNRLTLPFGSSTSPPAVDLANLWQEQK